MRVGVDIQSLADVTFSLTRFGDRYRQRLFTDREVDDAGGWGAAPEIAALALTARFAAKEATFKALQIGDHVPGWKDVELVGVAEGKQELRLHRVAATLASSAGLQVFRVSIGYTDAVAMAVVVATP
jgi:holo-[acyl-carrier protein] synthase